MKIITSASTTSLNEHLPRQAGKAIQLLESAGYECYLVGGGVRDALMGIPPKDIDIATIANPNQVKAVFASFDLYETGIKHGTVSVRLDGLLIEITTYRVDGNYINGRHPNAVTFAKSISQDLSRRDFTINALAFNKRVGLIDMYGGADDIKGRVIRAVGEPSKRFSEDGLRILRGLRFASTLAFLIDDATYNGMLQTKNCLTKISGERITAELRRMLVGENAAYSLRLSLELFEVITPTVFSKYNKSEWEQQIRLVTALPKNPNLRLSALLCKNNWSVQDRLTALASLRVTLKLDNASVHEITSQITSFDITLDDSEVWLKQILSRLGEDSFHDFILLKRGEATVKNTSTALIDLLEVRAGELIKNGSCLSLKQLDINGNDLILLGIPPGKEVGLVLDKLLSAVIEGQVDNSKKLLLQYAKLCRSHVKM